MRGHGKIVVVDDEIYYQNYYDPDRPVVFNLSKLGMSNIDIDTLEFFLFPEPIVKLGPNHDWAPPKQRPKLNRAQRRRQK